MSFDGLDFVPHNLTHRTGSVEKEPSYIRSFRVNSEQALPVPSFEIILLLYERNVKQLASIYCQETPPENICDVSP